MIRRISMGALTLLLALPLAVQAQDGLMMRLDASTNAADPDDVPNVQIEAMGDGFQVTTGPAVLVWNEEDTATGTYTLSGTFTLQAPSGHVNFYGLVYGGGALEGSSQNYVYFLVAQNGTFVIRHRANDETLHDIVAGRMEHEAIATPGDDGKSVNELEVRVGESEIQYVVNGVVVHTTPNSGMAGRTDGIWGVRINHVIPGVLVEGLGVSN